MVSTNFDPIVAEIATSISDLSCDLLPYQWNSGATKNGMSV